MFTVATNPTDSYSVTRCSFADLAELMEGRHISRKNNNTWEGKMRQLGALANGGDAIWYGGIDGPSAAVSLMRDGWKDGADKAAELAPSLTDIVPPAKNVRRRVKWDEIGTELNIDRAMQGDFDRAWRNTGPHPTTPRVLSLACNFGGNAGVSHDQLFWCAAQMIVVANVLEQAGYAVELRAVKYNQIQNGRNVLLDVTVKEMHQPLRPDAIAAVFGHAGVYRSFGHMLLMTSPYDVTSGLGHATDITSGLARAVRDGLTDRTDYVLEHAYSMYDAARNITAALTSLVGVER